MGLLSKHLERVIIKFITLSPNYLGRPVVKIASLCKSVSSKIKIRWWYILEYWVTDSVDTSVDAWHLGVSLSEQ